MFQPAYPTYKRPILKSMMIVTLVTVASPIILLIVFLLQPKRFVATIGLINRPPISLEKHYKDKELFAKAWNASPYRQSEYQNTEGFCGTATLRNILISIKGANVPAQSSGAMSAETFADTLHRHAPTTTTHIVTMVSFADFVQALELANDHNYRVSVNFLRAALFGWIRPLLPHNGLLSIFGGHFSYIVGYLRQESLVAVFDVNHKYGYFLVDAAALYSAVCTWDFFSGKQRALVVTKIN